MWDILIPMSLPTAHARELYHSICKNIETVIRGQEKPIRHLLATLISGGHVLLEDVPGTGKTTLAKSLALSIQMNFKRVQFTPDLLPTDILGVSIFNPQDQKFHFHPGPIFTHVLLVDEINRASPRTQSALLEAMAEGQVSVDGTRHPLNHPFFVIATQNPVEFRGTYPLPEAQMDRFAMHFRLGYVSPETETRILRDQIDHHPILDIKPCATLEDIIQLGQASRNVRVSEELIRYTVDLAAATRGYPGVQLGASPRASIALVKVAQALALFDGTEYVTPDQIQEIAVHVIAHRLVLDPQARFSGLTSTGMVEAILRQIPVPS